MATGSNVSMETDDDHEVLPLSLELCMICERRVVRLLFIQCGHKICDRCCICQPCRRSEGMRVTCPVKKCTSLIPSDSAVYADPTPPLRTSPINNNNKRNIFHTLKEYRRNKCQPTLLKFPTVDKAMQHLNVATHPETDEIFVSDHLNHQVYIFSPLAQYKSSFGSRGNSDGQFEDPWGIAVNKDSEVLVADVKNRRIQFFRDSGHDCQRSFGSKEHYWSPMIKGVAFDERRYRAFCVDRTNVKMIDLAGETTNKVFPHPSNLNFVDVAVYKESVYASSMDDGSVYQFEIDGLARPHPRVIKDANYEGGQFAGITLDESGHLLVCDQVNNCLKIFDTDSETHSDVTAVTCDDVMLPGRPCSVAVQRGTMNIVVSYFQPGSRFGEGGVAVLNDPAGIHSPRSEQE